MKKFLLIGSLLLSASALPAAITMTISQIGNNVVVSVSGSAKLAALSPYIPEGWEPGDPWPVVEGGLIYVSSSDYIAGSTNLVPVEIYSGLTGPTPPIIGSGGEFRPNSGGGPTVGILYSPLDDDQYETYLAVPFDYDGEDLSATNTYQNQSLTSMGLTEGTYVWSWGADGNADTFTLVVQVPEPAAYTSAFAIVLTGFLLLRRRFHCEKA